ncbi:PAS domain-containing hybrid sensor histidine kinase/response regulator [Clostridium beijerinckii]|uniref:PAS domain-containing hybrid sensor histidine kinase/response regulator n=1 Tax=Clostridium beijerinckii TaxID=1520 RepID=UPI002330BCFF|nr:PAS domain S-box protein [Clostridium beijerinckii]
MPLNSKNNPKPSITISNEIVIKVTEEFVDLTGYYKEELLGKSYKELSKTLKTNFFDKFESISDEMSVYIFTKSLEPREVIISKNIDHDKTNILYFFHEKENSRIENKFLYAEQLCFDNKYGIAIYSAPDIALLKANEKYINYLDEPFNRKENCIGKTIGEIVKDFNENKIREKWTNVISKGETCYVKDFMSGRHGTGVTYFDSSIVPIYENGKVKYYIENRIDVTDRMRNKVVIEAQAAEIERRDKKIEAIMDLADEQISIFDKSGRLIKISKVILELFQANKISNINDIKDEIMIFDVNKNKIQFEESKFSYIEKGKEINNYRVIIGTRNFEKHVVISGKPIFDRKGNFERYVLLIDDITESVQAKIIEEQKNKLEAIIRNMSDGLFTIDKEGDINILNSSAKDFFCNIGLVNKISENLLKVKFYDSNDNIISPENMPSYRVLRGEKVNGYRMTLKRNGLEYHFNVSGSPLYDEGGDIAKALLCTRNITEQINSNAIIKMQKKQLEAVIENISDAIYIADKEGKIILMNAEGRSFLSDSYAVKNVEDFNATKQAFDTSGNEIHVENLSLKCALRGEKIRNRTVIIRRLDKELTIRVNSTPIYDTSGNLIMALACYHDITDLAEKEKIIVEKYRQLELLKEEAEIANKIKSLFLDNMSHEIRTPMNGIFGTIQLLEKTPMSEEQSKYITLLKNSGNKLLTIINNILDISKIEAGIHKLNDGKFSLKKITDDIYTNLLESGNSKGLEIRYYFDPDAEFIVIGDELKLKQILDNLISNAVKFTEKGYISFRVTKVLSDNDYVKIKFTIADTGIGIDERFKSKIFGIFSQGDISVNKKYTGTGLGLSISKQLAMMMNGKISFESTLGEGSTFMFTCSFKKSDYYEKNIEVMNDNKISGEDKINNLWINKSILCIETNSIDKEVMESIVERKGCKYIHAYNINEALKILKRNYVDLILIDMKLDELEDFEKIKKMRISRVEGKNIPIIGMSSYTIMENREILMNLGIDQCISKPFNVEEIYNIFEIYL